MTITEGLIEQVALLRPEPADVIVVTMPKPSPVRTNHVYDFLREYGINNPVVFIEPGTNIEAVHVEELLRRAMEGRHG